MSFPDPRITGGLLPAAAPALEIAGFDAKPQQPSMRMLVLTALYWSALIGEVVALRLHAVPGAQHFLGDAVAASVIAGLVSMLSFMPWFAWLRKSLRPTIDIGFTISPYTLLAMVQAYIVATWILREPPPMLWVFGGFVIALVLDRLSRWLMQAVRRSQQTRRMT